jgi:O-antigen ligase
MLFLPNLGYHEGLHDGDWRGAFLHKNAFGQFMVLGTLSFGLELLYERKATSMLGLMLCLIMVIGSNSITAWLLTPVLLLTTPLIRHVLTPARLAALLAATVVVAILAADLNWDAMANTVGRDATLTGRVPLWLTLIEDIRQRPLLGYGFGAYWLGEAGLSPTQWLAMGWSDSPRHAHNAFLDVVLDTGVIGLLLMVVQLLVSWVRVLAKARTGAAEYEWAAGVWLYIVLFATTGGEMFVQNSVPWVLLVAITTQLGNERRTNARVRAGYAV